LTPLAKIVARFGVNDWNTFITRRVCVVKHCRHAVLRRNVHSHLSAGKSFQNYQARDARQAL